MASAGGVLSIAGCSAEDDELIDPSDGALEGELAIYIADDFDGTSHTRYALRSAGGQERPLTFDSDPGIEPNTRIKVWGTEAGDALRVVSFKKVPVVVEQTVSPLINGAAYKARTFAFILVDVGSGLNIDEATAATRMVDGMDSIRNYYLYDSYGRQDISAKVFSASYPMSSCDTSGMSSSIKKGVLAGMTFDHYLFYIGQRTSLCSWGGLGQVGTGASPAHDTWYNGSTSCVVLVQEPGHNFGMQHSSSLDCGSADFADDPNSCTASEYGDTFDPMGGACRHMNAWQKSYQGWFGGCNGVTVNASGDYTLLPFESRCDGAQFLKIKGAKPRPFNRPAAGGGSATVENLDYFYVELRTPLDFDGTLGNRTALTPMLLIHAGSELVDRTKRAVHTFLLDMTPSTSSFSDAQLAEGKSFTDPAGGVTITAKSVTATQATVTVTLANGSGTSTCLDGSAFMAPGPGPDSCVANSPTPVGGGGASGTGTGGATGTGTGGSTGTGGMPGGTGGRTGGSGGAGGSASGSGGTTGGTGGSGGANTGSGGRAGGSGGTTGGTGGASGGSGGTTGGSGGTTDGSGGSGPIGTGGGTDVTGSGGSTMPVGTGGSTTGTSTGGSGTPPGENGTVTGGCACSVDGGSRSWAGTLVLLGLVVSVLGRRRNRRPS